MSFDPNLSPQMTDEEQDKSYTDALEEYYSWCAEKAKEIGVPVHYYIEEFELW